MQNKLSRISAFIEQLPTEGVVGDAESMLLKAGDLLDPKPTTNSSGCKNA